MAGILNEERLRKEPRRGTIVVVRVTHVVRVELDLAVVEVEVRRVVEPAISVWILLLPIYSHRISRFTTFRSISSQS